MSRRCCIFHCVALLVLLAGASLQQVSAARHLSAPAPAVHTWLPHKDARGQWQPADTHSVDITTLSLSDMPPLDVFVEIVTKSPYPMPPIPVGALVNNTMKEWSGGRMPSNVVDYLLLLQGASKYVSGNVPALVSRLLPNVTLDGASMSLADAAGKVLGKGLFNGMPIAIDETTGTFQVPLPDSAFGVGVAAPTVNLTESLQATFDTLSRLPTTLMKVGSIVAANVESMADKGLPTLDDMIADDGTLDIPGMLKASLGINASALSDVQLPPGINQLLMDVSKSVPKIAQQLGVNTTQIKMPDMRAISSVLQAANGAQLFLKDSRGRVDLVATITQLPTKLPQIVQVVQKLPVPTKGWPKLDDLAKIAEDVVGQLS